MDWDLWIKIGAKFPIRFIPETFAALAVFETTKSVTGGIKRYEEIIRMLERNGSRAPLEYYKAGLWHYRHDNMREARRYFLISPSHGIYRCPYTQQKYSRDQDHNPRIE